MDRRSESAAVRASLVTAVLVWTLVAASPIAAGLVVSRTPRGLRFLVPVAVAVLALAVALVLAEPTWRFLSWLITAAGPTASDKPGASPHLRAANLVSRVVMNSNIPYSAVMREWPDSADDELLNEALAILTGCRGDSADSFSQSSVQHNLKRLNDLLNRLRDPTSTD